MRATFDGGGSKTALVMVGLPARGKSFMARKLARYLGWLGKPTRVFNVGSYRRELVGEYPGHDFFDPDNAAALGTRREAALTALDDMLHWLAEGGEVGVYDATNTTRERRELIARRCADAAVEVVFIESICDDASIVESNIRETKLRSLDYMGMTPEQALEDFRHRLSCYSRVYEPIADEGLSFVKVVDAGRKVVVNRIEGYTAARVVAFLMNLRLTSRLIYVTRHGESTDNERAQIGGDAPLSERGARFADALAAYFRQHEPDTLRELTVWTSTLQRTIATAAPLGRRARAWRALDEIDAGVCEGMTYQEISERMPHEYAARGADKLRYRYPRGESYEDVIARLDPLIAELERQPSPLLIIGHQAVLRALIAYLVGHALEECPYLTIPLHTVIELSPNAYGCDERRIPLLNDAKP